MLVTGHEPPWIEVHDSQHKFEESASCDFNFEVVRWSTKANIGYLSHQIIPILGEQGVVRLPLLSVVLA